MKTTANKVRIICLIFALLLLIQSTVMNSETVEASSVNATISISGNRGVVDFYAGVTIPGGGRITILRDGIQYLQVNTVYSTWSLSQRYDTSVLGDGSHLFTIVAVAGNGSIGSASQTIVTNNAPLLNFVLPNSGSTIRGVLGIDIYYSVPSRLASTVEQLAFYVDNNTTALTYGTFALSPDLETQGHWQFTIDTGNWADGQHTLKVVTTKSVNVGTASVDMNTNNTIVLNFISPISGSTVHGVVGVDIYYSLPSRSSLAVEQLAFRVDYMGIDYHNINLSPDSETQGNWQFTIDTSNWADGQHSLKVYTTKSLVGATALCNITKNTETNQPPVASFTYSPYVHNEYLERNPAEGETITFDASASSDPDGDSLVCSWSFGDGNTGSGKTVTHNYSSKGDYTVTLQVADEHGAKYSMSKVVKVVPDWRKMIHIGDILFDPTSLGGLGHCAIYYGNGRTVEAQNSRSLPGVVIDTLETWDNRRSAYLLNVKSANDEQRLEAARFAFGQLLKPYQIPWTSKDSSPDGKAWYCSELVWAAYINQGINLEYTRDNYAVSPREIYLEAVNYPNIIYIVSHRGEEATISIVWQAPVLAIYALSPVNLEVTDPNGLRISEGLHEVFESVYMVDDMNDDGSPDKCVLVPERKSGEYHIVIRPETGALPTDTYSIVAYTERQTVVFASNVQVSAIPQQGYILRSTGNMIIQIIPAVITTQPSDVTVNAGQTASFSAAASGSPTPTVQWQVSTDGGASFSNVAGAIDTTLSFTATASQNGYKYRVVFTNAAGTATSNPATLTVNTAPVVTTQPSDVTVNARQTASFSATASGSPTPTVQWQVSTDGGSSWNKVTGAMSTTLSFTATASQSGYKYHAVFTNTAGSASTTAASLTVNKATQTITFATLANKTYGDGPFAVSAAASSGLPVSFSIASGPATISGNTVTITGAGTVTMRASQAGNENYSPSPDVDQSFTVNKATQTITFATPPPTSAIYNTSFTVAATASSGLPVIYSSSIPLTNTGATYTMTSGTGMGAVKVDQAGNDNYNAAPQLTASVAAQKANQTITFGALANKTYGDADFTISATASSGLAVTFTTSGACTISGNIVHITGVGSCTVTAHQSGNANYNAAPDIAQTFTVNITYGSLGNLVQQYVTQAGVANSLLGKLDNAMKAEAKGNANAKAGMIGAFINEVQAQTGKAISAENAAILIALAQAL